MGLALKQAYGKSNGNILYGKITEEMGFAQVDFAYSVLAFMSIQKTCRKTSALKEIRGCFSDVVSFEPSGGFFPRSTRLAQAPQAESIAAGMIHDEDDCCCILSNVSLPANIAMSGKRSTLTDALSFLKTA